MADQRTMAKLLQAPTEGYGDAIVILAILAENFKLKHGLLNLVTSKQFYGFKKEDPHAHIRCFNKITSTIKYKDVPNSSIKLMLFPFSIEGAARIWLEKEPPRSILTWEDLVSNEAWDRFKDLLRACPHHCFTELHQLDMFYNALNPTDQDSLNVAVGGNQNYQAPPQVGPSNDLSSYMKTNDVNMKIMQNQITNMRTKLKKEIDNTLTRQNNAFKNELKNELTNDIKNMMSSVFQMNTASSTGSGSLPSNTVANPMGDLKAITT
ncbi:hypothetical protein Tco_0407601 [Tanacetum coccineum]